MSFSSVLSNLGGDAKRVFAWIGSSTGQNVIATGEAVVESVFPAATGIIDLANAGLTEAIKVEALAAAAGVQNGSGLQKIAAVTKAITPEVLAYAEKNGFPKPTAATIENAANGLVAFINALEGKPPA